MKGVPQPPGPDITTWVGLGWALRDMGKSVVPIYFLGYLKKGYHTHKQVYLSQMLASWMPIFEIG